VLSLFSAELARGNADLAQRALHGLGTSDHLVCAALTLVVREVRFGQVIELIER